MGHGSANLGPLHVVSGNITGLKPSQKHALERIYRRRVRPAEVASLLGDGLVAVRTARGAETIDASLVGDVVPGDLLLVHAGAAIERLVVNDG